MTFQLLVWQLVALDFLNSYQDPFNSMETQQDDRNVWQKMSILLMLQTNIPIPMWRACRQAATSSKSSHDREISGCPCKVPDGAFWQTSPKLGSKNCRTGPSMASNELYLAIVHRSHHPMRSNLLDTSICAKSWIVWSVQLPQPVSFIDQEIPGATSSSAIS